MKQNAAPLKVGEMSDEIQDLKILELEKLHKEEYGYIRADLRKIKDFMYNQQQQVINNLEKRINALEKAEKDRQKLDEKQDEKKQWLRRTISAIAIGEAFTLIGIVILVVFGLK